MNAQESLARRLGLFYDSWMQDWEWEIAEPARFWEWLDFYRSESLTDAERRSLMEMLLQCIEDESDGQKEEALCIILQENASLHKESIEYWACRDAENRDEEFKIAPMVRGIRV
jgi:hypothetical protein